MGKNLEVGNCRKCETSMTIYQTCCPKCGAKSEECFVSKAQQKENLKAVRRQIIQNMKSAIKEQRW